MKYDPEFKCDFTNIPKNSEFNYWKNIILLDTPLKVASYVIKGFGRGGKQLGMPTGTLLMFNLKYK